MTKTKEKIIDAVTNTIVKIKSSLNYTKYLYDEEPQEDINKSGFNIENKQHCKRCGNYFDKKLDRCTKCGSHVTWFYNKIDCELEKKIRKIPIIAIFLSLILPGIGQIYNNELKKGISFVFISLLAYKINIYSVVEHLFTDVIQNISAILITAIFYLMFYGYQIVDAYETAEGINSELKKHT